MSKSSGLGFGGLLLGLGVGWIALNYFNVSLDIVPYLVIIVGAGIVVSTLIFKERNRTVSELTGGLIGGLLIAVVFSSAFGFTSVFPFGRTRTGSGDMVTREFDYQGFTDIDVSHGFSVTVTEGDDYSVSVTVDDNVVDYLKVTRSGDTLSIGLEPRSYDDVSLEARVTMPALNGVELSGGSWVDVSGFSSSQDFALDLSGGSHAVIVGSAGDLTVDASGGSSIDLSGFKVQDVRVEFSGGSSGSVYVGGVLDVDLSSGSRLVYYGDPELGDVETSGGSSISPK